LPGQAAQRSRYGTEPPVSVPIAAAAMPSVTDTAALTTNRQECPLARSQAFGVP
jgi:hypothetical protein